MHIKKHTIIIEGNNMVRSCDGNKSLLSSSAHAHLKLNENKFLLR